MSLDILLEGQAVMLWSVLALWCKVFELLGEVVVWMALACCHSKSIHFCSSKFAESQLKRNLSQSRESIDHVLSLPAGFSQNAAMMLSRQKPGHRGSGGCK